ncbi:hypothetical protein CHS0354_011188 [Potamilus streckersoni]|uniref:RING-type E3 ubiquitin transferase n=1 Tax=Potamilus streckersoni TaxID=2493646 RepID=A0AAE0S0T7_9BIVA|nr:hypothetical protein CHS0354_011188 [Potamilus streckersoni]
MASEGVNTAKQYDTVDGNCWPEVMASGGERKTIASPSDYTWSRDLEDSFVFVNEKDEKYDCPICLFIQREPTQTTCGHRFCRDCIVKWLRNSEKKCPICVEPLDESYLFTDNFAKREILDLVIRCIYYKEGCDQNINLRHFQSHLCICDYAYVQCPNSCANILLRRDLQEHKNDKCPKRIILCKKCGETIIAEEQEDHFDKGCPKVEIFCPFCKAKVLREQLERHKRLECSNVVIQCEFRFLGCQAEMTRMKMSQHQSQAMVYHISLIGRGLFELYRKFSFIHASSSQGQPRQVWNPSSLRYQPGELSGISHSEVTHSLDERMDKGNTISSLPSTLQSVHQLQALFENVQLQMSSGASLPSTSQKQDEVPDQLTLRTDVTVLQSQGNEQQDHDQQDVLQSVYKRTLSDAQHPSTRTQEGSELSFMSKPSTYKDNEGVDGHSFCDPQYISFKAQNDYQDESLARHDQQIMFLRDRNEYLERANKDMKIKIKQLENTVNEFEGRFGNGEFIWRIKNYAKLRDEAINGDNTAIHSPPFFSSCYGYKLCIRVNLNGVDSAKGTHLSVFIHFMQGENDDCLDWPFSGRIILSVLDQNPICEMRRNVSETLASKPNLAAFQRPTSQRNHKGFGYMEFLPLSVVSAPTSTYVKNDTLLIKAKVISS